MFGVDFGEIMVIMVVALLVLGPERLPKVARTMGRWWGNLQRYVDRIKADVNTSMELEELRAMERKIKAEAEALERNMQKASGEASQELRQVEQALSEQTAHETTKAVPPVEPPAQPK